MDHSEQHWLTPQRLVTKDYTCKVSFHLADVGFQGMAFQRQKLWVPVPDKSLGTGNRNIALKSGKVVARKIKAGRNLFKQNDTQNLIK